MGIEKNGQLYFTFEEFKEHPAVVSMMNQFHADYKEQAVKLFYSVFNRHNKHLDSNKYGLKNLKRVKWVGKEQCFHVYYKNGDWWHYTRNGEWY